MKTPKRSRSRTAQRQNSSAWERLDHNRACRSAPCKLCRRAHHILRELGVNALATPGAIGVEWIRRGRDVCLSAW